MLYTKSMLGLLDLINYTLNLCYKSDKNKYAVIISKLPLYESLDISLTGIVIVKFAIKNFLYKLNLNFVKISGYLDIDIKDNDAYVTYLDSLDIWKLLKHLALILSTITLIEQDNIVLCKYTDKQTHLLGWNNLSKESRGILLDAGINHDLVSYPFDKFFNLNENEYTSQEVVEKTIIDSDYMSIMDKKDGTLIIVSNYKGKIILNTTGDLNNMQIKLALNLFKTNYAFFYTNMPVGRTFLFELIHPKNKIKLDYGKLEKLYLLAIRDLVTLNFSKYTELQDFCVEYKLDLVEQYVGLTLNDIVLNAAIRGIGREGWVVHIMNSENNKSLFVKVKYEEYLELLRQKTTSLREVYILWRENYLDDVMANASGDLKEDYDFYLSIVNDVFKKIPDVVQSKVDDLKHKYGIANFYDLPNGSIKDFLLDAQSDKLCLYTLRILKGARTKLNLFDDVLPTTDVFNYMLSVIDEEYKTDYAKHFKIE